MPGSSTQLSPNHTLTPVLPTHSAVSHSECVKSYLAFIYLVCLVPTHLLHRDFYVPSLRLSTLRYQRTLLQAKSPLVFSGRTGS